MFKNEHRLHHYFVNLLVVVSGAEEQDYIHQGENIQDEFGIEHQRLLGHCPQLQRHHKEQARVDDDHDHLPRDPRLAERVYHVVELPEVSRLLQPDLCRGFQYCLALGVGGAHHQVLAELAAEVHEEAAVYVQRDEFVVLGEAAFVTFDPADLD